jgi:hypothetical protein
MVQAIRTLPWDVEFKVRTVLFEESKRSLLAGYSGY